MPPQSRNARLAFSLVVLSALLTVPLYSQVEQDTVDALQKSAPKVYIDCSMCDQDYIRTEIPFVNYVRDRKEAQVHVMLTQMYTGSGGTEYTITFIGQLEFEGTNDTLKYNANKSDTQDMTRKGMVKVMKMGLVRYVIHTPLAEHFTVAYNKPTSGAKVVDKWDYWVVSTNLSSWFNGESQYNSNQVWGGITASRVTEDWKFRFSVNMSYNDSKYEFQTDDTTTTISRAVSRSQWFSGSVVKSLTDHWSAGIFTSVNSATYSNIELGFGAQPGIEYNIFPYNESTRRQLRLTYQIGFTHRKYVDTTIYFKKSEFLYLHSLTASLTMQQPWGSTSFSVSESQYLHDLSKNSLNLSANLSLRVFEGLSVSLYGGYSAVHDQLNLGKSSLTAEEVYQQRRELAKSYSYYGSFGFSYSFGSIFNNIVNARFGNQGTGGTTIVMSSD